MKTKNFACTCIVFTIITLFAFSANAQTNEEPYSIKNRWTVKASVARYKTVFLDGVFVFVGDYFNDLVNRKMVNFKIEANYGINKFIEIGVFTGFQHYEWVKGSFRY